jgi:hypothetical protein
MASGASGFSVLSMWGDNAVLQFAAPTCQHAACPTPAKVFGSDAKSGEVIALSILLLVPSPCSNQTIP